MLLNGAAAADWDKDEYTKAQANIVAEMLRAMETLSGKLSKHVTGAMSNSHARRMDYHLHSYVQYYRFMRTRATRLTGEVEKVQRQLKVSSFFSLNSPEKPSDDSPTSSTTNESRK